MEHQDIFVLVVALLATVLAVASGWLRYDNANDEEETSEFWYDTGVVLGVLYMVTIVIIYFAQTSHGMYQTLAHDGAAGAISYGAQRARSAIGYGPGSAEGTAHPAHPAHPAPATIGDWYGGPRDPALDRALNAGLAGTSTASWSSGRPLP
jgi:hypothetical protein